MGKEVFTHKGWIGICPVYIGDVDAEAPVIEERHIIFRPLLWFSTALYGLLNNILPEDEQVGFPIKITGKINRD